MNNVVKSSIASYLFFAFVLSCTGFSVKPKAPIKIEVIITSGLPAGSKTLFAHCTMDAKDFGNQALPPNGIIQWNYPPTPKEPHCSCDFIWDGKYALVEVAGDLSLCRGKMTPCKWVVKQDGFYFQSSFGLQKKYGWD